MILQEVLKCPVKKKNKQKNLQLACNINPF